MNDEKFTAGYSDVNGIKMYYEIHGQGQPLVLVHGGGSTIQTTYGNIIPLLSKHRQVIAMDLEAHGRTGGRAKALSFEQDADDIYVLLQNLGVQKADFFGFSNGAHALIELALRHPAIIKKMILASGIFNRNAVPDEFWRGFEGATVDMIPLPLKEGFLQVNNSEEALLNMFNRDVERMKNFKGWSKEQIQSISRPTLIVNGNNDLCSAEHVVETYRAIEGAQLLILPGNHGSYIGAVESLENGRWTQQYIVPIINEFLEARA